MPDIITNTFYLEFNPSTADAIPMSTPAWELYGLDTLLDGPDVRGNDLVLPGASGVRARKRRATVSRRRLVLRIFGAKQRDGTINSDEFAGLVTNIGIIRSKVSDPYSTGDGTRAATLHFPGGATRTANVHVISPLGLQWRGVSIADGVLILEIPAGAFA